MWTYVNEDEYEVTFVKKATNKGTTTMKSQNTWSQYLDNTHNKPLKKNGLPPVISSAASELLS